MSNTSYLTMMLVWLTFEAALALVLAAADSPRRGHAAAQVVLAVVRVLLVAMTAMQLGRAA